MPEHDMPPQDPNASGFHTDEGADVAGDAPRTGGFKQNFRDGRSRTMLVVMIGGVFVVTVALGYLLFGGAPPPTETSAAIAPPRASDVPSAVDQVGRTTPDRLQDLRDEDEQRADAAAQRGASAAVRPLVDQFDFGDLDRIPVEQEQELPTIVRRTPRDIAPRPLPREEREQQERVQQTQAQQDGAQREYEEAMRALTNAKREEMVRVINRNNRMGQMASLEFPIPEPLAPDEAEVAESREAEAARERERNQRVVVPAGELFYASMEDRADSDLEAPIFVRLAQGPLRGARLRGTFQMSQDRRCLVIQFDQITPVNGPSVGTQALGINPEDGTPCLVTERNGRYMARFGGIVLVGALGGFGEAARIRAQGTVVTTPQGGTISSPGDVNTRETVGLIAGNVAEESQDIVREAIKTQPQVIVAKGTPLGVRFLQDVLGEVVR